MQPGEHNVYAALVTARNAQLQAQWTRIQMFLVFNTVAIPLVFATGQSEAAKTAISVVAGGIHVALILSAFRSASWISFYDFKLVQMEQLDSEIDAQKIRVSIFSSREFEARQRSRLATRRIFTPVGVIFVVFWVEEAVRRLLTIAL